MSKSGWLPEKEFKYIYSKVPRLCVDLVIQNEYGIVLSKRDIIPDKGKWHLPGGTVLNNESLKEAVERIAKNETGLKTKTVSYLGNIEFLRKNPHAHAVSLVYLVKPVSGKLRGSSQAEEVEYFKKIPVNTIKEHSSFLNEHLKGSL
jgi:ADP-ribose pyrophosphatase YjhB (NUDIX family)